MLVLGRKPLFALVALLLPCQMLSSAESDAHGGLDQLGAGFRFEVVEGTCKLLWCVAGNDVFGGLGCAGVVGDVDGDGVRDILAEATRNSDMTALYQIRSGRTGALLQSMRGEAGFFIQGTGDFDADGLNEVVMVKYTPPWLDTPSYRIRAFSPVKDEVLWELTSSKTKPEFGRTVRVVEDLNDDGVADLMIASDIQNGSNKTEQAVFVVSGRDGSTLRRVSAPRGASWFYGSGMTAMALDTDRRIDYVISDILFTPSPKRIEARIWALSGATRRPLWCLRGRTDALYGADFVSSPDLDGDGVMDLINTAPNAADYVAGVVEAISGETGKTLWSHLGDIETGQLGRGLAVIGDIDEDGIPEVAAGAPALLPPLMMLGIPGHFVVLSGIDGSLLTMVKEVLPKGPHPSSHFGMSLYAPGDLDDDGRPDLVVSAPNYYSVAGGTRPKGLVAAFSLE